MIGNQTFYSVPANVVIASNIVPATIGIPVVIKANQKLKCRWWIKATVGATGGIRALVAVPAAGVSAQLTYKLWNTVAPSVASAAQQASGTAFTNALANAGTHFLEIEAEIVNGANDGTVDLQIAQNSSDALSLTVLAGGSLEAILHN